MKTKSLILASALMYAVAASPSSTRAQEFAPRGDGFIGDWLVLSPIQLEAGADGAQKIDEKQVADEANLKPKAGDKATANGKEMTWKKAKCSDYFLDLNELSNAQTERTVGYAVTYIRVDEERKKLQLRMGSNDQGKVYLNGKEVLKDPEGHALEQDMKVARNVTLDKGVNVLVFKIFNEGGPNWQGCLRFTDASGLAITNLVVQLDPQKQ